MPNDKDVEDMIASYTDPDEASLMRELLEMDDDDETLGDDS